MQIGRKLQNWLKKHHSSPGGDQKKWEAGCSMPVNDWAWLNCTGIFEDLSLRDYVAPFPPKDLMHIVSGLTNERDFAQHGVDIYEALIKASPKPFTGFQSVLDFGCGCGRLARMFKGYPHKITGCDIDQRLIQWVSENLNYMIAVLTQVNPPLPFGDNEFDAVISISIFSHLSEKSQDQFLPELLRITRPEGYLFLTIHGTRALERAKDEKVIRDMLAVDSLLFEEACVAFSENRYAFILHPHGHLTGLKSSNDQEPYQYGITFIPEAYVHEHWGRWFHVVEIRQGAIHDFQDIIVLRPKK